MIMDNTTLISFIVGIIVTALYYHFFVLAKLRRDLLEATKQRQILEKWYRGTQEKLDLIEKKAITVSSANELAQKAFSKMDNLLDMAKSNHEQTEQLKRSFSKHGSSN
jgi:vacuolar-type H+-ATPase subunit E/Vma4